MSRRFRCATSPALLLLLLVLLLASGCTKRGTCISDGLDGEQLCTPQAREQSCLAAKGAFTKESEPEGLAHCKAQGFEGSATAPDILKRKKK